MATQRVQSGVSRLLVTTWRRGQCYVVVLGGGAAVVGVRSGSLASRAPLKKADMILRVDDLNVRSPEHLEQLLAAAVAAGKRSVKLRVTRPTEGVSLYATLPLPARSGR